MVNCNPTRARNPTEPCGKGCRAIGTCKSNTTPARTIDGATRQCKPGKTRPCGRGCRALNKPCKIDGTPGVTPVDTPVIVIPPRQRRTEAQYQALLRKALRLSKEQKEINRLVSILGMNPTAAQQRAFDTAVAESVGLTIVNPTRRQTAWERATADAGVKPRTNRQQRGVL